MFVRSTVHYPAPGHYFNNSNSDRFRVVYSVVYKGDKNKIVVKKKMKFFLFVFKVLIVS